MPCPLGGRKWSRRSKTAGKISFLFDKRAKLMYVYKNVNLGQINYCIRPSASLALRSVYCYSPNSKHEHCPSVTNCVQNKELEVPTQFLYIELWHLSLSLSFSLSLVGTYRASNCTSIWHCPRNDLSLMEKVVGLLRFEANWTSPCLLLLISITLAAALCILNVT